MGIWGVQVDPNTDGYWPPWIVFALAAALIAIGLAVLISLFHRVGRAGKSLAPAD